MKNNRMVKRVGTLALCAIMATSSMVMSAGAVSTNITAQISPNISVIVDGVSQTFYSADRNEVHPIIYNGTTYLPLRAIGELMGKNVNWDQNTQTASLSGTRTTANVAGVPDINAVTQNVSAIISTDITVTVDGVVQTFTDANGNTVYPMLYNGSIYLPLRSIGSLMGKSVGWNSATSTVTLGSEEIVVTDADSFNDSNQSSNPGQSQSTPSQGTSSGLITAEQAKSNALSHAGLSSAQVNFVQAKLDWDDGRQVYDVEFYTSDYQEYDYEIDATTGTVLSFDYDADHYTPPANSNQSSSYISQDEAIRIALSYVSGATQSHVRSAKLDRDDGRMEYEIEIIYDTIEYDFEIDAYTGTVLSRDMDSIYD